MKRGSEENNHDASPSLSTGEKPSFPLDPTVEILKKLPVKSLMRFRCVSKQWSSVIDSRRDFIDWIVARSTTQPPRDDTHFIFYLESKSQGSYSFIFSSTYPQNANKESVSSPGQLYEYIRGLILCWSLSYPSAIAIYNPTTRQSFYLPEMEEAMHFQWGTCLFGYDPLENQYKVLCLGEYKRLKRCCCVFTLGDPTKRWRNIQCNVGLHFPLSPRVCIDGAIYYQATTIKRCFPEVLMSFDVRSEIFDQVEAPKALMDRSSSLVNYQGKLGVICCENGVEIWVMEDANKKKQGWSKIISCEMVFFRETRVAGVTPGGEIVFVDRKLMNDQTLCVVYYDPKKNSTRGVEVQGTMVEGVEFRRKHDLLIRVVPDHVENTMRL